MKKHVWSSFAIVVMAILALGSTNSKEESPSSSTDLTKQESKAAKIKSQTSTKKSAVASIPDLLSVDSEVESTFVERMKKYEQELVAWNAGSDSRAKLASDFLELERGIQSLESDKPLPPPDDKEREWTSTDQKFKAIGKLIETDYRIAKIEKVDGQTITVSKDRLIDEDRRYIENAFVEIEVFRKNSLSWETKRKSLADKRSVVQGRIDKSESLKPALPIVPEIAKELETERSKARDLERIEEETKAQALKQLLPTQIPKDVNYPIIRQNIVPGIKKSLDVRLNVKVTAKVLEAIAMKIRNADPSRYERIFILYHLPGMELDNGCWATTHFNPGLELRIIGLSVEQEEMLKQRPDDPSRKVIGVWIDEPMAMQITIFSKDEKFYKESAFGDGSSGTEELLSKQSPLGQRFETVKVSSAGDHWLIDSKGNMQLRDNNGLISTAMKRK